MSRNVALRVMRGVRANMPALGLGELYLAIDEAQLYIGTSMGNALVLASTVLTPPAVFATCQAPTSAPGGPANSKRITSFSPLIIGGSKFWIPLMS